jgi:hypothetical protein
MYSLCNHVFCSFICLFIYLYIRIYIYMSLLGVDLDKMGLCKMGDGCANSWPPFVRQMIRNDENLSMRSIRNDHIFGPIFYRRIRQVESTIPNEPFQFPISILGDVLGCPFQPLSSDVMSWCWNSPRLIDQFRGSKDLF